MVSRFVSSRYFAGTAASLVVVAVLSSPSTAEGRKTPPGQNSQGQVHQAEVAQLPLIEAADSVREFAEFEETQGP
jgi:hypothetical protein